MNDSPETELTPVYFATTNLAKLSQARLVLSRYGFEVIQYIKHRRPYNEPYGKEREEFLGIGLDEVIRRAGRTSIVFIEDTTVRIHALSSEDKEVPGQETKEWFARTTHQELMAEIQSAGGDRRATVRSDILMHVPGLNRHVLFSGLQSGLVSETPQHARANIAYPWLGNDDFSSWFIPDGASRVLSAMSYEESARFDHREKCLDAVAKRLQEYQAIVRSSGLLINNNPRSLRPEGQMSLVSGLYADSIIVVVGAIGAGKTTIGRQLVTNHGFRHIEGSTVISNLSRDQGITARTGFDRADELFVRSGADVAEREVVWPEFERHGGPLVYTGARTLEGLLYLRQKARDAGLRSVIWCVDSPEMVRHIRVVERMREVGDITTGSFDVDSIRDLEYGAAKYGDVIADCHIGNARGMRAFLDAIARAVIEPVGEYGKRAATRRKREIREAMAAMSLDLLARDHPDLVISNPKDGSWRLSLRGAALRQLIEMTY